MSYQPGGTDYAAWRGRLAEANDPAFWPIAAIDAALEAGEAQFWCDGQSALVTRIVEYPGGAKVLEAIAGVGSAEALMGNFEPRCEQFARAQGANRMEAKGRLGWLKRRPKGWRAHQVVIVKDLADGH